MSNDNQKDLPWLINQTETNNEALNNALDSDQALQSEKAFLSSLRANLKSQNVPTPGEFGLARLKREIADSEKNTGTPFSGFNRWARPALAAALVVVVLQSALLIDQSSTNDENYQPLSGSSISDNQIQISFKPNTTEQQLREAILLTGGTIVDGPGELGVYTIALEESTNIEKVITSLSQLPFVDNIVEN
ncbi:hypothetical protein FLL45_09350 [Aliikangiella marina]|uniref:Fervidolysin-like N-terminal prodomain domain-containing protein n=1 Tax=Aliikangiella marina TaxID=1712262 RepID=A0A545TD39_9GAMM|nr:hypothetical protein [Aliikangiella marina]TQV75133.1 hypothetical protein FLL45_09350 [Aliikangiella marina]